MQTPIIVPDVQNVRFPTEKEVCLAFAVERNGHLVRVKRLGEKAKKNKRLIVNVADTMIEAVGEPGSKERIEALRKQYEQHEANDTSPFSVNLANAIADMGASKGWDLG